MSNPWTANQLVAFNLGSARRRKGWTQEQAAEQLEPYLGERWSKATFSAAERSVAGERVREFTADELLAFSRAFDEPIVMFFLPPHADPDAPPAYSSGGPSTTNPAEMLEAVLARQDQWPQIVQRLGDLIAGLPPKQRTEEQDRWVAFATAQTVGAMRAILGDLVVHAEQLENLAGLLRGANQQAAAAMAAVATDQKEGEHG